MFPEIRFRAAGLVPPTTLFGLAIVMPAPPVARPVLVTPFGTAVVPVTSVPM